MTFAERAKPLKEKRNITLRQIAEACNISESMVSRYLNGLVVPPEDVASNILYFLQDAVADESPALAQPPDMASVYASLLEGQRAMYEAALADAREDKRRWFLIAVILIVFVMFLLGWDITHPNMGYIRY